MEIPNRPAFRAQEVCDIAGVQLYVLRTWEAEFPDLGVSKTGTGPRVYRRADVERVLHIKHLLFVEGLTLAGVRRRLGDSQPVKTEPAQPSAEAELADALGDPARDRLREVRQGLAWILEVLEPTAKHEALADQALGATRKPRVRKHATKSGKSE